MLSARPPKVLIVMPRAHRHGGAENILWTYLRHVDRTRLEPALVFLDDGPFREEVAGLGMPAHVLRPQDGPRPWIASYPPRLARIVRRERADVIFSWMVDTALFGSLAGVLSGRARRSAWWQANMPEKGPVERAATALTAQPIFFYSHATAAVQREIWPPRRTIVVHPGVEPPARLTEDERRHLRDRLELPAGRMVIGIAGRLMHWKGQHHVIRAIALLRDWGVDAHGLIVGGTAYGHEPGYEPELRRLTRDLSLEDRITFTGQVPDATPYMQLMDVAVNASDHEPFGIVLLEAMALDVPVVAVGAGGPAEIVEDGVSGVLVPAAEPARFADAFARLADDPGLRRRLADGARRRYEQRFTVERMVRELTDALADVAGARHERPAVVA